MSFDLTDLHRLIVRAHDRYNIPIGKVMRVALQAAAKRKFPLYKGDGSRVKLSEADRTLLLQHAAIAEQQTKFRWWTKKPWIGLCEVQASEPKFWKWFDGELAAQTSTAVAPAKAKASSGAKSQGN
jgi:hypothetical protein